jgi:hypothetical protein
LEELRWQEKSRKEVWEKAMFILLSPQRRGEYLEREGEKEKEREKERERKKERER